MGEPYVERYIFTTATEWSYNAERAISRIDPPVQRVDFFGLDGAAIEWDAYLRDETASLSIQPRKRLRPHQLSALNDVIAGFETNDRGKLAMAGRRAPGRLRTMQVATATAALALVAVDLSGLADGATTVGFDEAFTAETEAMGTPAGTEMMTAREADSDEEVKSSALAAAEGVTAPPSAEAAPVDRSAFAGQTAPTGRTAIEWLLSAVALVTAVLALAMTAWTWRATQRPLG